MLLSRTREALENLALSVNRDGLISALEIIRDYVKEYGTDAITVDDYIANLDQDIYSLNADLAERGIDLTQPLSDAHRRYNYDLVIRFYMVILKYLD
jgi:hypothetical protein